VIFAEAALKVHIILFYLGWEGLVASVLHRSGFLIVDSFTVFVLQVLDGTVKLLFKHVDGFNRIFSHIFSKIWAEISQVIKVDV